MGDLISFNVLNVPELTTKLRVGSTDDVYLPLVNYVHIEGLTLEEAQTLIEKRLSDGGFVIDPPRHSVRRGVLFARRQRTGRGIKARHLSRSG